MFSDARNVLEAVQNKFRDCHMLVVGDLILDRYLWGTVERISPEAPVPVVRLDHQSQVPGGAANVAANLSGFGCKVALAGVVGEDEEGCQLAALLKARGIETSAVLETPDRPTISKTRIIGGRQQMLRLDAEKVSELGPEVRARLLARVEEGLARCGAVVLSDYGKGLLDESACRAVIRRARDLSKPVYVDPKGRDYKKYAGCDVICPNRAELAAATSADSTDLAGLFQQGERLRRELEIGHVAVTLGELGIALLDASGIRHFPAQAREVFDVSGAGDTVISTLSAAMTAGLPFQDSIRLANLAAGIVIRKVGTVPISKEELVAALATNGESTPAEKVCSLEGLLRRVAEWRAAGQRMVFTNGCFDLFHAGHLALFEHAKREGDQLVVALNTDRSVRALKGPGRPIISQESRVRLVAALPCVDAVVLFDDDTPLELIRALRPEVLVKGSDRLEEDVVGAKEMKEWGGKVTLVPVSGDNTTTILRKAVASLGGESEKEIQQALSPELGGRV